MSRLWIEGRRLLRLHVEPMLASWNRADDPEQQAVQTYLAKVEDSVRAIVDMPVQSPLYLWVHVALPSGSDLLVGRDLENCLTPIAQRLQDLPLVLARGTKVVGGRSFLELGIAKPQTGMAARRPWESVDVLATGSVQKRAWKVALRQAIIDRGVVQAPDGPLSMRIAVRCSRRRAWHNVWKPLGDSLGPILGEPLSNPFNPSDDRIVDLSLHLEHDDSGSWDVGVQAWWRSHTDDEARFLALWPVLEPLFDSYRTAGEMIENIDSGVLKVWRARATAASVELPKLDWDEETWSRAVNAAKSIGLDFIRNPSAPQQSSQRLLAPFLTAARRAVEAGESAPYARIYLSFLDDVLARDGVDREEVDRLLRAFRDEQVALDDKRAADERMLDGLDQEPPSIRAEVGLKNFAQWAQNYESVVALTFHLARLGTRQGDPWSFGSRTHEAKKLLQSRFPDHVSLVDERVVHIRNAVRGHDKFVVNEDSRTITLWDENRRGDETYREAIRFDEVFPRLDALREAIDGTRLAAQAFLWKPNIALLQQAMPVIRDMVSVWTAAILRGVDDGDWTSVDELKSITLRALGVVVDEE